MTDDDKVRALLAVALDIDPPRGVGVTANRVRARRNRRRVITTAAAGVGVVVVVVGAVVGPDLIRSGGTGPATAALPTRTSVAVDTSSSGPSAAPSSLAVAPTPVTLPARPLIDGDLVGANGGVVAIPGRPARWCPGGFATDTSGVAYLKGHEPPASWCAVGVDVTGVDLSKLSFRRTSRGVVWGYAYLRGRWHAGAVEVTLQTEPRLDQQPTPRWTTPPCRESAAGSLPVGPATNPDQVEGLIQSWSDKHPGEIVTTVQYRPQPTRAVMVVAAEHPALVRAGLHLKASELCVVQSRYSTSQIAAARAPFEAAMRAKGTDDLLVTQLMQTVDEQAQTRIDVQVAWWTPALAKLGSNGATHVSAWLSPLPPDAALPPPVPSAHATATDPGTATATEVGTGSPTTESK